MTTASLSNRDLMVAVMNGSTIEVSNYIDSTYGYWCEFFTPATKKIGYLLSFGGTSNWTYCSVCGDPAGKWGCKCNCNHDDENHYKFFLNSDLVSHLRKLRNKGYEITIK